jgi:hypothetical protein
MAIHWNEKYWIKDKDNLREEDYLARKYAKYSEQKTDIKLNQTVFWEKWMEHKDPKHTDTVGGIQLTPIKINDETITFRFHYQSTDSWGWKRQNWMDIKGAIVCKNDALLSLVRWDFESQNIVSRKVQSYLTHKEKGELKDGFIRRTISGLSPIKQRLPKGDLPVVCNWTMMLAASRLMKPGMKETKFHVLEDLCYLKTNHSLRYKGEYDFDSAGNRVIKADCYLQLGEGILPYHYWKDKEGSLLFLSYDHKYFYFLSDDQPMVPVGSSQR